MQIPGLKQSVISVIPDVFAQWEGRGLPYMYADSKGIVTFGTGNALFSIAAAQALDWRNPDGSKTSAADVAAAYERVRTAFPGVQSVASARLTSIRLSPAALAEAVVRTVSIDWGALAFTFRGCAAWPADAQLALMSIAWAWGAGFARVWNEIPANPNASPGSFVPQPGFGYGDKFRSLVGVPPEFVLAAGVMLDASAAEEHRNPGIAPRDAGEVVMFRNAAQVISAGSDPETLWYPREAA